MSTGPATFTIAASNVRLRWITHLRALATVAVVLVHVAAENVIFSRPVGGTAWWAGNLADSASRWCVPVFVMISGALLLTPERGTPAAFYRRRAQRILVPLVVWSCVYFVFRAWAGQRIDLSVIAWDLLAGVPFFHLWYLFMIVGLFAVTPPLRAWVARTSPTTRGWTIALLFAVASAHDWAATHDRLPTTRTIFTLFLPYLGYYLCGYQLRASPRRVDAPRHMALASAVALAMVAVIALGTHRIFQPKELVAGLYLYEYLGPPVILLSLSVFVFFQALDTQRSASPDRRVDRALASLCDASLGIYVIHPLFLEALRRAGLDHSFDPVVVGLLLRWGLTVALSWLAVSLLARVPVLRRTVQG